MALGGARGAAVGLGLALAGILAALAVGEVALRMRELRNTRDLRGLHEAVPGAPWLYALRPGARARLPETGQVSYVVNADGFRDERSERPKPTGLYRVLALGDSVTFGYGVARSDVYTEVMEERLAELGAARPVEVMNWGVGGYSPYNEAALLAGRGRDFEPDLVLVQFCINDLNDPTLHFDANTRLALGELPEAAYPDPGMRAAKSPTPGASLCGGLLLCHRLMRAFAREPSAADLRAAFEPRVDAEHDTAWGWLEARYREIAATAGRMNARFAVLVFPYSSQVEPAARDRRLQERMGVIAGRNGWATVDLLPAFRRAAAASQAALFVDVWHPTAEGHRIAGEAALRALACRGLLPEVSKLDCEVTPAP